MVYLEYIPRSRVNCFVYEIWITILIDRSVFGKTVKQQRNVNNIDGKKIERKIAHLYD